MKPRHLFLAFCMGFILATFLFGCASGPTETYNYRSHLSSTSDREACDVVPYYNAFDPGWGKPIRVTQ